MNHCWRHGVDHPYGRTCPECHIEREGEQHEELLSALSELRDSGNVSEQLDSIRAGIAALQSKLLNERMRRRQGRNVIDISLEYKVRKRLERQHR